MTEKGNNSNKITLIENEKHHMEKFSLEDLMGKQIRPANIDLQLKQVNEEIYSRQGGLMSNARGKDGSLKKVNNILLKSMIPLMRVADKLYLADTTEAVAPSMKTVFDQCMTSLTLLCEANLEVETLRREAFKPTTPRLLGHKTSGVENAVVW